MKKPTTPRPPRTSKQPRQLAEHELARATGSGGLLAFPFIQSA